MYRNNLILSFLVLASLMTSCVKSIEFGEELLENEFIDLLVTDTIDITARTVVNDSLLAFDTINIPTRSLLGHLDDPIFGVTNASTYLQIGVVRDTSNERLFLPDGVLDSLVLRLRYDTNGFYGPFLNGVNIEVREVLEDIVFGPHQANENLEVSMDLVGESGMFIPREGDFVMPLEPSTQTTDSTLFRTDSLPRVVSIRLSDIFAEKLFNLSPFDYDSDETLREMFKGLKLSSSDDTDGIFTFNMENPAQLNLYFHYEDTANVIRYEILTMDLISRCLINNITYDPSCVVFSSFENDHSQGLVDEYIDDEEKGEEFVFIQSTLGLNTIVSFPSIMDFAGVSVNQATLIVEVADVPDDQISFYPPLDRLLVSYEEDGALKLVEDVSSFAHFDGNLRKEDSGRMYYSMNITAHFQDILDGEKPNSVVVSPNQRAFSGNRVPLYGPGSSIKPMKLILAYTK